MQQEVDLAAVEDGELQDVAVAEPVKQQRLLSDTEQYPWMKKEQQRHVPSEKGKCVRQR